MKLKEYMETVYGERHSEEFRKKERCGPFPMWNMDNCTVCEAWKIYDMVRKRCAEALCEGCAAGNPVKVICGERVHPCSGLPSNFPCAAQAIYEPE